MPYFVLFYFLIIELQFLFLYDYLKGGLGVLHKDNSDHFHSYSCSVQKDETFCFNISFFTKNGFIEEYKRGGQNPPIS